MQKYLRTPPCIVDIRLYSVPWSVEHVTAIILSTNKEIHVFLCYLFWQSHHYKGLLVWISSNNFFHEPLLVHSKFDTIDNIHKEKMSQLFNFTEAELVNQGKSIQTLRIRLCIWSSKCTIKTNIFEMMSILLENCIYLSQSN